MTSVRQVFDAIEGGQLPAGYAWARGTTHVFHVKIDNDRLRLALCGKATWRKIESRIFAQVCRTCWKVLACREGA